MTRLPATRLGLMYALEFAALGSVMPIFSVYLIEVLGLSGAQAGTVQACSAVSAIVAPIYGSIMADRRLAARHLLAACHVVAAVAMVLLHGMSTFPWVLASFLLHQMAFAPTIGLTNAIAFQHLEGQRGRYGSIRVWGTIGWVAVSWGLGWWLRDAAEGTAVIGDILLVSGGVSLVLALVSCLLPPPPEQPTFQKRLLPVEALRAWRQSGVWQTAIWYAVVGASYHYHFLGTGPFLRSHGVPSAWILPLMACAQMVEIPAMLLLRRLLVRLGNRRVMLLGGAAAILQFVLFAFDPHPWLLPVGIACHGLIFTWFSTVAVITIDEHLQPDARAGVHQLLGFLSPGCSAIVGGLSAGLLLDLAPEHGFVPYWSAAAVLALIATIGAWWTTPRAAAEDVP